MIELEKDQKLNIYRAFLGFLVVLVLFFFVKFLSEVKTYGAMKDGNLSSIVVEGKGEVQAVPDIATVTFSIRKEGKTVKEAQDEVAKIEKLALDSLKKNEVADKDVKTSNASFYPKYEYKYDYPKLAPCTEYGCPPQNGKNVIVGYEASESITVKVRNVDTVGKVMQDLGTVGVSDLSGPNFAIDDEETLKTEARAKAIAQAKSKAEVLAKDLGVRLVRIVSFNESGSYYPMPMYASGAMMKDSAMMESAPAQVPKGENTITSNVTITYEIR